MGLTNEAQNLDPTVVESEYEWGVRYRSCWTGKVETLWGFKEDPQLSGVVDAEGEIEIRSYYHPVVAVGKRPKVSAEWKSI